MSRRGAIDLTTIKAANGANGVNGVSGAVSLGPGGDGSDGLGGADIALYGSSADPSLDVYGGEGGNGGMGGWAYSTYYYVLPRGFDGGDAGDGAEGGDASVEFNGQTASGLRAVSYGGSGGSGGPGGRAMHFESYLSYLYPVIGGSGGDAGNGAVGGDALTNVNFNTLTGPTSAYLQASSIGGRGGSGGGGQGGFWGQGGSGITPGAIGTVGVAAQGGLAETQVNGNVITSPNGGISASASGGSGGTGGSLTYSADVLTSNPSTPGGVGGDARVQVSGNVFTGAPGANNFSLTAYAFGGAGGPGFLGGAVGAAGLGEALVFGNTIDLGDGNDTLTIDLSVSVGGTLVFAGNTFAGGAGFDTLAIVGRYYVPTVGFLGPLLVDLSANTITGFEKIQGSDNSDGITGTVGADVLDGGGGSDVLKGGGGDDSLTGGTGADTLEGGSGIDTAVYTGLRANYAVLDLGDGAFRITDLRAGAPDGIDTLRGFEFIKFSDQTVAAAVLLGGVVITGTAEVDTISATKTVAGQPLPTTHNDLIYGLDSNDVLDGAGGADAMIGGLGDDSYTADHVGDEAIELAGQGIDSVKASVSYTLGDNLENLTLTGAAAIDGTGNGLANKITGNNAANVLTGLGGDDQIKGMGGADTLWGESGADKLDGGTGADTMYGGADNDSYTVDDSGDQVIEAADEGIDSVSASATFTLGANVENLTLTGAAAIDGTGNDLDNKLTGNAAANVLTGNGGADQLKGMDGADVLWGGAGADKLDGGLGADEMRGGADKDGYTVDDAGDTVIENAAEGNDTVSASVSFILGANVENLTLTGAAAIDGTGNELANTLKGNAGDNVLTGGAGKDSLTGGAGADTFVFGPALATSTDKISDFAHGVDHLAFHAADYGLTAGELDPANLVLGPAATHAHAEFVYDAAKKTLYWDADGFGGAAAVAVATFSTAVTLTAADFVILA